MVTNLMEKGRRKCEQYWPGNTPTFYPLASRSHPTLARGSTEENESLTFEADASGPSATVTCLDVKEAPAWVKRTFEVAVEGHPEQNLRVLQLHYTAWPDRGASGGIRPLSGVGRSLSG